MEIRTVMRGNIVETAPGDIAEALAGRQVLVDIGSGDGKFPYRMAKENPDLFCVGIDPAPENLMKISGKIGRKKSRGGVDNLLLIAGAIDILPSALDGAADRVTVNFPWGSLLRGVAAPEDIAVSTLRRIMKDSARLDMLLNLRVFEDTALRERLGLPNFNISYVDEILAPAYMRHGLIIEDRHILAPEEMKERTSWGRQLTAGSGRNTMAISAAVKEWNRKD